MQILPGDPFYQCLLWMCVVESPQADGLKNDTIERIEVLLLLMGFTTQTSDHRSEPFVKKLLLNKQY